MRNTNEDLAIVDRRAGVAMLYRTDREDLMKKVRVQQKAEEGEGVNHSIIGGENHPGRWTIQRPRGRTMLGLPVKLQRDQCGAEDWSRGQQ